MYLLSRATLLYWKFLLRAPCIGQSSPFLTRLFPRGSVPSSNTASQDSDLTSRITARRRLDSICHLSHLTSVFCDAY